MPGIKANASSVGTISSHHPWRESKQIRSSYSEHDKGGSHRMMNEAKSTVHCRIGTDEKQSDPWICKWDLKLCFVATHLAAQEDWLALRDIGFLWWGWCAVSQHVLGHNAICSSPTLCDATRCYSTLWCRTVIRTDFQSILITLQPGIQFILQYCGWMWTEIDLKREILFQWEINYCLVSTTQENMLYLTISPFMLLSHTCIWLTSQGMHVFSDRQKLPV